MVDGRCELFIRTGGSRILAALPEAAAYSFWKALHAATLPIFPVPLDESIEPRRRREHLLPVMEPSAARAGDLARELFDRLDLLCRDSSAWSALFVSAVSELPGQPLQPRVRVYLKEFIGRHPEEAWSLVSQEVADGPLGALVPILLPELRGQNTQRWHQAIQGSLPGTRLFEMELGALCSAGELDPVERAVVSRVGAGRCAGSSFRPGTFERSSPGPWPWTGSCVRIAPPACDRLAPLGVDVRCVRALGGPPADSARGRGSGSGAGGLG